MSVSGMSRLEVFIGTWNTTGEVLGTDDAPATTLVATDTYRWLPGRHFIVHEADARLGSTPTRSMEVIGYDRSARAFTSRAYDDQGGMEEFKLSLKGRRWSIVGKVVRFDGKFSEDRSELKGLWEMKGKKGRWQPWIVLKLERA